jgi:8-oxo-dGTP diphosphatase
MAHAHRPVPYRFCPVCGGSLATRVVKPGDPPRLVCEACGYVLYLNPRIAAGAIVAVDGRVVLLRRAIDPEKGRWVFPGGFVDRGETVDGAAVRETREEVNLDVEVERLVGVYSYPGNEVVIVVYAARVTGGEATAGDECLELAFQSTREALADYLKVVAG